MVDEEAEQRSFQLKVEATHAPDQVIAGVPFPVHYRVGNLGEAISPVSVEELMLGAAQTASARYASLAASWTALQERIEGGEALSFVEA